MFKKGDRVKAIAQDFDFTGRIGTIAQVDNEWSYFVDFGKRIGYTTHNGIGKIIKTKSGYYLGPDDIELTDEKDLAPCPFSTTALRHEPFIQTTSTGLYKVQCTCGASGPIAVEEQEAIDNWNGR